LGTDVLVVLRLPFAQAAFHGTAVILSSETAGVPMKENDSGPQFGMTHHISRESHPPSTAMAPLTGLGFDMGLV
jgi:hypothetical protein